MTPKTKGREKGNPTSEAGKKIRDKIRDILHDDLLGNDDVERRITEEILSILPTSEAGKQEGWEQRFDEKFAFKESPVEPEVEHLYFRMENEWGWRVSETEDIKDFIRTLLETSKKEAIEENEIDFTKRMEQVAKDVREEVVEEIRGMKVGTWKEWITATKPYGGIKEEYSKLQNRKTHDEEINKTRWKMLLGGWKVDTSIFQIIGKRKT